MPYTRHPSEKLVSIFKQKPWQGNDPAKAKFIFMGLDANYDANIEKSLPEIFEYLYCGVDFWRLKKVHHPFRLPHYHGCGRKYHDKFAEIGFTPEQAELVSFVEILHEPTEGRSNLILEDLSDEHLEFILDIMQRGTAKYIFMFSRVVSILQQTKLFQWLPRSPIAQDGDLKVLRESNGQKIYQMYHLSCYGWQLKVLNKQINQIRRIVETIN